MKNINKELLLQQFLSKASVKHGNKFDYSKIIYISCKHKVEIICPIHQSFSVTPDCFIHSKYGCPKCAYSNTGKNQTSNTEEFIKKASIIHNNKYDYSLVNYIINSTKIDIICPKHGKFSQIPANHLRGKGCTNCKLEFLHDKFVMGKDKFVELANKKYPNQYNYDLVIYINCDTKVYIKCLKHNQNFEQTPYNHLNTSYGCPLCSFEYHGINGRNSVEHYINKSNLKHNNKYQYIVPQNNEALGHQKWEIKCPEHGSFLQSIQNHIAGNGCPKCSIGISKKESEIQQFYLNNQIPIIVKDRQTIKPLEIDILLSNHKLGIEYNGVYWHSELAGKNSSYHLKKLEAAQKAGVRLIQIFESEMESKPRIVFSRLKSAAGLVKRSIFARKCEVREILPELKNKFLHKYHIQDRDRSLVNLGLFYKNRLVSVMTFCRKRVALGQKVREDGHYELSRFASVFNFSIVGGASKLLKFFERKYSPKCIITYADRRWSVGKLYEQLGFKFKHNSQPNYWYFHPDSELRLFHRFNFRKDVLKDKLKIFNPHISEWENMKINGWNRIWDCGNMVFEKNYA